MSAPELLTEREQELLAAVCKVLDIPNPRWQERDQFEMVLRERTWRLLGAITNPAQFNATAILRTLESIAARPLGYEPAPDESSP